MTNYVKIPSKYFCYILAILSLVSCYGQNSDITSGIYDNGNVEILKGDKYLTGIINFEDEEINCKLFFFKELVGENDSLISFLNPVDMSISRGSFYSKSDEIKLKSQVILFPCQRIVDLYSGEKFFLSQKYEARSYFNIIKSEKCFLYEEPDKITNKKSYLINGDIIIVHEIKNNWLKINYINNKQRFYWIKSSDVFLD